MIRTLTLLAALLVSNTIHAAVDGPVGSLWAFGDSLTDSGNVAALGVFEPQPWLNLIPNGAYTLSGTLSNGQVWVQQLNTAISQYNVSQGGVPLSPLVPSFLGGRNFAVGGARTGLLPAINLNVELPTDSPSVATQAGAAVTFYGPLPADGLYVINGGGNDVRAALTFLLGQPTEIGLAVAAMAEGARNLQQAVSALFNAGARNFLIPNIPDLGRTPALIAADATGLAAQLATALVAGNPLFGIDQGFNDFLATELSMFGANNPSANLITMDSFALFNELLDNLGVPGTPGALFTNATDACTVQNEGAGCGVENYDNYIFWDGLHPTSAAHQVSANAAFNAVVPLPAALWLCLAGCGLLARVSSRRR